MYKLLKLIVSPLLSTMLIISQNHWPGSATAKEFSLSTLHSHKLDVVKKNSSSSEKIDYDSVVRDIIKLIEWLSLPDMTPARLNAKLRGSSCPKSPAPCDLVLINNRSNAAPRPLQGLKTHPHIMWIAMKLDQNNTDHIDQITIFFDDFYQGKFSIDTLNKLISGGRPLSKPWSPRPHPSCTVACLSLFQGIAVDKKFLKGTGVEDLDYYCIRANLFAAPTPLKFVTIIIDSPGNINSKSGMLKSTVNLCGEPKLIIPSEIKTP